MMFNICGAAIQLGKHRRFICSLHVLIHCVSRSEETRAPWQYTLHNNLVDPLKISLYPTRSPQSAIMVSPLRSTQASSLGHSVRSQQCWIALSGDVPKQTLLGLTRMSNSIGRKCPAGAWST